MKFFLLLGFFGLMAVAIGDQRLLKTEHCPGTECPAGCCPEVDWFCCKDDLHCFANAEECPLVAKNEKIVKMDPKEKCNGTECPAGCCPEADWFCCKDNLYCAETAKDCPFITRYEKLGNMDAKKQCDGTDCRCGCCPEADWYCCSNDCHCASPPGDNCPQFSMKEKLLKIASANCPTC